MKLISENINLFAANFPTYLGDVFLTIKVIHATVKNFDDTKI